MQQPVAAVVERSQGALALHRKVPRGCKVRVAVLFALGITQLLQKLRERCAQPRRVACPAQVGRFDALQLLERLVEFRPVGRERAELPDPVVKRGVSLPGGGFGHARKQSEEFAVGIEHRSVERGVVVFDVAPDAAHEAEVLHDQRIAGVE